MIAGTIGRYIGRHCFSAILLAHHNRKAAGGTSGDLSQVEVRAGSSPQWSDGGTDSSFHIRHPSLSRGFRSAMIASGWRRGTGGKLIRRWPWDTLSGQ